MLIRLDGTARRRMSTAKDVALRIIAEIGVAGARGHVVEYAGAAVRAMPIEQRMTLCNLNIEMGGRSGFVAPDESTFSWIAGRPFAPQGAMWERALAHWRTLETDEGAMFDREHVLDCSGLEPQITWGTDPSQVLGISGRVPDPSAADQSRRAAIESALAYMGLEPGMTLAGLPVDRVFIGSCTNSRLPDLQAAADVVRGRHVAEGVIAMVVPGSTSVKREAEAAGLDRVFRDAGFLLGRVRVLDVRRRQRRSRRAGRALRLDHQPQFRTSTGTESTHASRQPGDRRRDRHRRAHRRRAACAARTDLMQPFTRHTGIAVPLIKDDINTDQIAPVQSMRNFKPDYQALLFMRARRRDDGSEDPDFVLNQPQFRQPGILVTGHNFGAGSSREAAVWGMLANNIRVIVARSFADIYRENCLQNGLLPIVLAAGDGGRL